MREKLNFYFTHKIPIFLYASEVWPLNITTLQAVKTWHRKSLRTVIGKKWNPKHEDYHEFLQRVTRKAEDAYLEFHKDPVILYVERYVGY